ncbi:hypothetical protein EDC94DRAFT_587190 [Helicostylum pulchrum]|nr:hypothetical protein EDC94DRAFT_587190 [Helicostylum pulchrum]
MVRFPKTTVALTSDASAEKYITNLAACFNMFFLTDQYHHSLLQHFGTPLLDQLSKYNHFGSTFTIADSLLLAISNLISSILDGNLNLRIARAQILVLSAKDITLYELNLLNGISYILDFLPKKEVDISKLGRSELWSACYHP